MSDFSEKYKLKGKPIRVSEYTKQYVKALYRRNERILEAGKDYALTETRRFNMKMSNTQIDEIRRAMPSIIASEILSVQPMASDILSDILKMPVVEEIQPKQGEAKHDFINGYMNFYGTEWINADLWMKLKIKGL